MMRRMIESLGMIVNGASIALFFFLVSVLEISDPPLLMDMLAWVFFALGIAMVVLSSVTLWRNRGRALIEKGIYGIVRHPMYLGAMLLFVSWIFFLPHWSIVLISCLNILIIYGYVLQGEQLNLRRFGDAYHRYMQRVPRLNFLTGLFRARRRR